MNRQLVDDWFDAFRNKDISILDRALAEEFVHTSPFGEIKGRQAYLDLVRANGEAFFSPKITILDVLACGERFAARYLVDDNPACDCIYTKNGQISKIYSYYHLGEKPVF